MVRRGRGRSGCASQARSRLAISKSFKKNNSDHVLQSLSTTTPKSEQEAASKSEQEAASSSGVCYALCCGACRKNARAIQSVRNWRREEEKEEAEEETPWRKMFLLEIDLCLACLTRPHFNLGDTPRQRVEIIVASGKSV